MASRHTSGYNKCSCYSAFLDCCRVRRICLRGQLVMPSSHQPCLSSTCPPWLQAAVADIEQRVRSLTPESESEPDSFAERAENYYQKRPQLITLLQDLRNRYLYLADRYSRQISTARSESDDDDHVSSSDAESSLSFQPPPRNPLAQESVVADLVMASVDRAILVHELAESERARSESARKMELQGSLVEVLESERLVLLSENARLGFHAAAMEEEARGLAAEAGYMWRKAAELARLVVKLRDDHRVCLLGRKIEGLQAQIYGLERRNREYYEAMTTREAEKGEARVELDRLRAENRRLRRVAEAKGSRWWARLRRIEWASCGPQADARKGCFQW